jgi:membrane protease YdiL (CAAX protease family)
LSFARAALAASVALLGIALPSARAEAALGDVDAAALLADAGAVTLADAGAAAVVDAGLADAGAAPLADAGFAPLVDGGAPFAEVKVRAPPSAAAESIDSIAPIVPDLRPLEPEGLPRARLTHDEPPTEREVNDLASLRHPDCNPALGSLFPGAGSYCTGHHTEGEVLIGVGALELGTGLAFGFRDGFGTTQAEVPLLAFGDLLTASALDGTVRLQRAKRMLYVPEETLSDDFSAPFRLDVLRQPDVFLGIIGTVGVGVLFEQFLDGGLATTSFKQRPQLFGKQVNPSVAYPVATAIGLGMFSQVAAAEELAFRGLVQSSLTRGQGETAGWLEGSLIFGLFHATNAVFLPADQRVDYLTRSVPYITLVGSYLGYTYMQHNYSLSPSIAVHFWYDFLIEAVAFVLDPKNSPLSYVQVF